MPKSVREAVHAVARLHAQEDAQPVAVIQVAKDSNSIAPPPPAGCVPQKIADFADLRTILANPPGSSPVTPSQKTSKYSSNRKMYKHTKRARVQAKSGET